MSTVGLPEVSRRPMKKPTPPLPPPGPRQVGYARVSTSDQQLDMQTGALVNAGCHPDNIHSEYVSGVAKKRPKLELALIDCRPGDTFVVWKLDRLGRSLPDLLEKLKYLDQQGIKFRSLTEGIDTSTPGGRLITHVMGSLAQFERDLVVERTKAGMAAYRERGGKVGQPMKLIGPRKDKAIAMLTAGKSVTETAHACKVSPGTIYNHFSSAVIAGMRAKPNAKLSAAAKRHGEIFNK